MLRNSRNTNNRITSEDSVEEVLMRIGVGPGEDLRESERRRSSLEKFARFRSRNPNTTLDLKNTNTAYVRIDGEEGMEEFRNITVTSKQFDQVDGDLPEKYHDYMLQRAFTVHEVGHILFSSWDALEHFTEKVKDNEKDDPEGYANLFHHFYNVLEDGAIEKFLAENFRVGSELYHLRRTLHEDCYIGSQQSVEGEVEYIYPFFFAIVAACINIGIYDNGEFDKLLDENNDKHRWTPTSRGGAGDRERMVQHCLPKIEEYIPKIQSETDAFERTKLCYELWDFLVDYIKRAPTRSRDKWQSERGEDSDGDSYAPGIPKNIGEEHGDQEQTPRASGGEGEEESLGEQREKNFSPGDGGGDLEDKAEREIISEAKNQNDGDWSKELEEIIDALEGGEGVEEIEIAESGDVDTPRKLEAKRLGKQAEKIFKNRLQNTKQDVTIPNQLRGDFNKRSMIDAERGSPRVFEQLKEGEEKNYSCIIVIDRSGSMSGWIEEVELAASSIAWGLEKNGVDVSILDTHNSMTTLAKPFGTETENFDDKLLSGRVGGGTPITGTMKFMQQRIDRGENDYPFAIVITDGGASRRNKFKEEVKKSNFPIYGMYVNTHGDVSDQLKLYDKATKVKKREELKAKLMSLINDIIL